MPLKVIVDDVFDGPLNFRTGEGITELVVEVSYDGKVWNFEYEYELAFLAMSGGPRDARFEFVEAFMEDNFRGIFEIKAFKRRFCTALVTQGLSAFVGDAEVSRADEMALLVAIVWYINEYTSTEPANWIIKRIGEIKDSQNDIANLTWSIDTVPTEESFTNTVKIHYELDINEWVVAEFDRFASKHTYDPVEINTSFEIEDYDDVPSHAYKLLDMFHVEIPDAVTPDDIADPVSLVTADDGAFFVIYSHSDDEATLEDAAKVRRFATKQAAMDAVENFEFMVGNLDDFQEQTEYRITLAMLNKKPAPGAEVQTSDLKLIRTWFYEHSEGRYFGDWKSIGYKNNEPQPDTETVGRY